MGVQRVSEEKPDSPRKKMGRPPIGASKPKQLGRVPEYLWEKLKRGAELAGQKFSPWALHVLLKEAERLIAQDEKEKNLNDKSKKKP